MEYEGTFYIHRQAGKANLTPLKDMGFKTFTNMYDAGAVPALGYLVAHGMAIL